MDKSTPVDEGGQKEGEEGDKKQQSYLTMP